VSDLKHAIFTLREFNLWRRADEDMDQPDPWEIGKAIDDAIEAMEELNEWKTLTSWGGTPEIINDFIKGQQSRICAAQGAEKQRDKTQAELDEERKEGEEQARLLGMSAEREVDLLAKNRNLERALEKAEAERELWRSEAQRWREQALELDGKVEAEIKHLQWRQDQLDRGIKELNG
jgi:predicted RNase H-like nuclease (RuvC/YqgF family)